MQRLELLIDGRSSALVPGPRLEREKVLVPVHAFSAALGAQVPATAGPKDQTGQGGQNQQIQQIRRIRLNLLYIPVSWNQRRQLKKLASLRLHSGHHIGPRCSNTGPQRRPLVHRHLSRSPSNHHRDSTLRGMKLNQTRY